MSSIVSVPFKNADYAHYQVLAAIDLGTNSCRLLVATVNRARLKKTFFRRRNDLVGWKIIDSFAKIVHLGEGLYKNDTLSEVAIQRAVDALKTCRRKIDLHGVSYMRAVATEACRRATNRHVLVDRVRRELDINIDVISGAEEARLSLTGCAGILNPRIPRAIMFDIGGGSTEVIWLRLLQNNKGCPGYPVPFEVIDSVSLPYGVVTISESYAQFAASPEIHRDIRRSVAFALSKFIQKNKIAKFLESQSVQLIGSSGTVTTLAAIQVGLSHYERQAIDGLFLPTTEIQSISQVILNMSPSESANHPCIGIGRRDLLVVGSAILEGICDSFPVAELGVADRGVREGILSELLVRIQK